MPMIENFHRFGRTTDSVLMQPAIAFLTNCAWGYILFPPQPQEIETKAVELNKSH